VSFAAITVCVAPQRVFIVVNVYFVIDSVRKLLDIPPQTCRPLLNRNGLQLEVSTFHEYELSWSFLDERAYNFIDHIIIDERRHQRLRHTNFDASLCLIVY
jgi:hypothetical protein